MDERIRTHIMNIDSAVEYLKGRIPAIPECAVILGSGLSPMAEGEGEPMIINYPDIPGFKESTAPGHNGRLIFTKKSGKYVVFMQGRLHCYEGYDVIDTVLPVRVFARLGIKKLIITNAAGGINPSFGEGALMLINDHIGFNAPPVLWGSNVDELGVRFPDMTYAYSRHLMDVARRAASESGVTLMEGVYAFSTGAQYETPAEIRALRVLGADAVGMSTVPEVVAARHAGMETLAISCITNMAAGIFDVQLTHEDVINTTNRIMNDFVSLMNKIIELLD